MADAQAALPVLRIEPAGEGSVIFVKNTAAQPLTAFRIELVDYPGSSFTYTGDMPGPEAIPAGSEHRFRVRSMMVGAAPDYVKVTAAIFEDGTCAGAPEKIDRIIAVRRVKLGLSRELLHRIEEARRRGTAERDIATQAPQWAAALAAQIDDRDARIQAADLIARLRKQTLQEIDTTLHNLENVLAASKPALH